MTATQKSPPPKKKTLADMLRPRRNDPLYIGALDFARVVCAQCDEQLEERLRAELAQHQDAKPQAVRKAQRQKVHGSLHGLFVVLRAAELKPKDSEQTSDGNDGPPAIPVPVPEPTVPHNPWDVCFVDANGWLEPLDASRNPWHSDDCADNRCAKNHRHYGDGRLVFPRFKHEVYLVRFPNPSFALGLCAHLNRIEDASHAQAAAAGAAPQSSGGFDFSDYPERIAPQMLSFDTTTLNTGEKCTVLRVPEDPTCFVPQGHPNYDGWTLHMGMANEHCSSVQRAVTRLQHHLGALRYPVGGARSPYAPGDNNRGVFDRQLLAVVARFQNHVRAGRGFLLASPELTLRRVLGSEAPFAPLAVAAPARADASRLSWRFLVGEAIVKTGQDWVRGLARPPQTPGMLPAGEPPTNTPLSLDVVQTCLAQAFGGVDAITGHVIDHWLRAGIRKAGRVLVEVATREHDNLNTDSFAWMREEAALRFEMWRGLVKAMGCTYGVAFSSSFRDLETGRIDAPAGMASQSIHKTGLAIDLAVVGGSFLDDPRKRKREIVDFSTPVNDWPVWFECTRVLRRTPDEILAMMNKAAVELESTKRSVAKIEQAHLPVPAKLAHKLAKQQSNYDNLSLSLDNRVLGPGKIGCAFKWRIYGHSACGLSTRGIADVKAALDIERDAFEDRVMTWAGDKESSADDDYQSKGKTRLQDWVREQKAIVTSLIDTTDNDLIAKYYRPTIRPFEYQRFEADGGNDLPELAPQNDTKPRPRLQLCGQGSLPPPPAAKSAKSWLNLTALGHACQLFRIRSSIKGFRAPEFDAYFGMVPEQVIRVCSQYRRQPAFGMIMSLLRELWANGALYEWQPIWIKRPRAEATSSSPDGKDYIVMPRCKSDYDLDFMNQWAAHNDNEAQWMGSLAYNYQERFEEHLEWLGAAPFADKTYLLEAVGIDTLGLQAHVRACKTGTQWVEVLRQAYRDYNHPSQRIVSAKRGIKKRTVTNEGARFVLQPVFEKGDPEPARYENGEGFHERQGEVVSDALEQISLRHHDLVHIISPGIGRTLEWWHYQTEAVDTSANHAKATHGPSLEEEDPEEDFTEPNAPKSRGEGSGPTWGKLMAEIGYSKVVVGELWTPPYDAALLKNGLYQGGYGYDVNSTATNTTTAPVENNWTDVISDGEQRKKPKPWRKKPA